MPSRSLVLSLIFLTACTGGEPTFEERATTACEQIERRAAAIPQPTTNPELDAYLTRVGEVNEAGAEKLRLLEPPPDKETDFRRMIAASEAANEAFQDWATAYRQKDAAGQRRANARRAAARVDYTAAAKRLGLTRCVPPSPVPTAG